MFLEKMTINDIKFGDTEGKREFSTAEKINNMFFKDSHEHLFANYMTGELRYIYGLKGTGKTSTLKYLENLAISKNIQTMYISYKDIKEEADVIHEFRRELENSDDKDTYTLTFWRWYILSLISKSFLNESIYDANNLIYNSRVKFFRIVSGLLDLISEVNIGTDDSNINIKFGNSQFDTKWDTQTSSRIRHLERNIKEKLDTKIIIFIDELEISKFITTYDVDAVLVKNLIRAARKINDLNENLHIVLAVRSEVVGSIATAGDEINKELEDFGFEIEWHRRKFDIHHPLLSMYIQKMRYSMKKYIEENFNGSSSMLETLKSMSNSEIWYRWFPKQMSSTDTPEFILQNTWLRPRDLSRLFRTMQNYSKKNSQQFTQFSYAEAIKKVGEDSWQEIKEELSSIYTEKTMASITAIIEKLQTLFTKDNFIKEAIYRGINEDEAISILHSLYRVSAIGNAYKSNQKFSTTYRFAYRNDKSLFEDKAIIIHKVIEHGLGLTDFNGSLLYQHLSDEERKKHTRSTSNRSYEKQVSRKLLDEKPVFNLQDALREKS